MVKENMEKWIILIPILILILYPSMIEDYSEHGVSFGGVPDKTIKITSVNKNGKSIGTVEEMSVSESVSVRISRKTLIGYKRVSNNEDTYLLGFYILPKEYNLVNIIVLWGCFISVIFLLIRIIVKIVRLKEVKIKWS